MPNKFFLVSLLVFICANTLSCTSSEPLPEEADTEIDYSFFVAGHVYGTPGVTIKGVHPPFREKLKLLSTTPKLTFGVLTGDSVITGNEKNYNYLEDDLKQTGVPVHMVAGNHELVTKNSRKIFKKRYGPLFHSWTQGDDLHIILDTVSSAWNIDGEQLQFLKDLLLEKSNTHDNIFIYLHNVIWWERGKYYRKLFPNSFSGWSGENNFWKVVFPLLALFENDIYVFAGDVGAWAKLTSAYYEQIGKIRLIASGMGGNKKDNFVIATVLKNGEVDLSLIALNGDDVNALGKLEDHGFIVLDRKWVLYSSK